MKLLTKRKQKWLGRNVRHDVVRGTPLNPNAAVESRYNARLQQLVRRMVDECETEIRKLFDKPFAEAHFESMDASIASQARILTNALTKKYQALFDLHAGPMAESMTNQTDRASSGALHASIRELSGGLSLPTTTLQGPLKDILKATIGENVALIKSIPQQYLSGVSAATQRSITTGNGLADLVPYLQKHKGITERRATLIARDQTNKAYANMNAQRMKNLGLQQFEWRHTGGSKEPRQLHKDYNGRIFSFDDLPVIDENTGERGIPGQAINCRCRMVPVLALGDD